MFLTKTNARTLLLHVTVAATLASFLAASTGFPLWTEARGKDLSQPFPCMHRRCGCRSAEQCWRGCCCFTNREKLAWASRQKVQVPKYVVAAAEREVPETADRKGCCSSQAKSCCAKSAPANKATFAKAPNTQPWLESAHCPGAAEQWMALGAIDFVLCRTWELELIACGSAVVVSETAVSPAFAPQSPPPWREPLGNVVVRA